MIVIFNCWGDAALPMLFFKLDIAYWGYLKSFLIFLDRIPEYPRTSLDDIQEDLNIIKELKGL